MTRDIIIIMRSTPKRTGDLLEIRISTPEMIVQWQNTANTRSGLDAGRYASVSTVAGSWYLSVLMAIRADRM